MRVTTVSAGLDRPTFSGARKVVAVLSWAVSLVSIAGGEATVWAPSGIAVKVLDETRCRVLGTTFPVSRPESTRDRLRDSGDAMGTCGWGGRMVSMDSVRRRVCGAGRFSFFTVLDGDGGDNGFGVEMSVDFRAADFVPEPGFGFKIEGKLIRPATEAGAGNLVDRDMMKSGGINYGLTLWPFYILAERQ